MLLSGLSPAARALLDHPAGCCRWSVGDGWCQRKATHGAYCAGHHRRSIDPDHPGFSPLRHLPDAARDGRAARQPAPVDAAPGGLTDADLATIAALREAIAADRFPLSQRVRRWWLMTAWIKPSMIYPQPTALVRVKCRA